MSDRLPQHESLKLHYSQIPAAKRIAGEATNRGFLWERQAQMIRIELSGLRIFRPDENDGEESEAVE